MVAVEETQVESVVEVKRFLTKRLGACPNVSIIYQNLK